MKAQQLDLFAWVESRPSAEVVDFIPHVIRQIYRQRGQPRVERDGKLVAFPPVPAAPEIRRTA